MNPRTARNRLITLFVLAPTLGVGACTHRHELPPSPPADALSSANDLTRDNETTVWTTESLKYAFESADIRQDSLVGTALNQRKALPLNEISRFSAKSRSKGMLDGVLIGSGIGLALGLVAPLEDEECSFLGGCRVVATHTRSETIGTMLVSGAVWGVVIGLWRKATVVYDVGDVDPSPEGELTVSPTFQGRPGLSVTWRPGSRGRP